MATPFFCFIFILVLRFPIDYAPIRDIFKTNFNFMSNSRSELHARLRREAKTPYKGLRIFIYIALAGSGLIGAVIFLAKTLAGNGELSNNLANLALQLGAIALMVWLYRLETKTSKS
jgi:hypothetical protein